MTIIPFQSKSFKEFYLSVNGLDVEVDFINRRIVIFNSARQIVSTVLFSRHIQHHFTSGELLNPKSSIGEMYYLVYPDGNKGENWLWAGKLVNLL